MKKVLAILCALSLVVSAFAGCSDNAETSAAASDTSSATSSEASSEASTSSESSEPVTLRYMWWGSQTRHDQNIEMLNSYMAVSYTHRDVYKRQERGAVDQGDAGAVRGGAGR